MRPLVFLAIVNSVICQELYTSYNLSSIELSGAGYCPSTEKLRVKIKHDVYLFLNNTVLPVLSHGACGCGGPGWRRTAYLNMSDPTQTCPPAWELITTPRRSCARPSNAGSRSCYSVMYPVEGNQYSQVCGRIVGYQKGQPGGFLWENLNAPQTIDGSYVDGVSLTYGNPRNHIWTFVNTLDEYPHTSNVYSQKCPCSNINEQRPIIIPSYVGNSYFCETGVPPGQYWNDSRFYADDPLWDGEGCGPTNACCTFNNPPWFCKQLPQLANADLEVRLCSGNPATYENTPIQLIEIYVN